jgi:hypothetical protein
MPAPGGPSGSLGYPLARDERAETVRQDALPRQSILPKQSCSRQTASAVSGSQVMAESASVTEAVTFGPSC